ncbi:MAG: energy transducer TonB [Acidobacteria bacterium]|nr:energy transducer TonB [Acidobacteriota bacterium]
MRRHLLRGLVLLICVCVWAVSCAAQVKVAVLDFGATETGVRAAEQFARALRKETSLRLADRDEGRFAARGIGYEGSLNLTLEEARDLGSAIGSDFYVTGDAQTLRRNSSARPVFYESYASIFLVSARSGRLIMWERPSFEAAAPEVAEKMLLAGLSERGARYAAAIRTAAESERNEREFSTTHLAPVIEEVPEETSPQAKGLRLPLPYRRLRPIYPETAARAEASATVDVLVDLDVEGEVTRVEVVRWAGFGLDDSTVNTIRQMHFRPALRDGVPLPMRVLLRYNFQRPKKETDTEVKK